MGVDAVQELASFTDRLAGAEIDSVVESGDTVEVVIECPLGGEPKVEAVRALKEYLAVNDWTAESEVSPTTGEWTVTHDV